VGNLDRVFESSTSFNIDLSPWDISSVTYMYYMFSGATAFNQVLCWSTSGKVPTNMFASSSGSASTSAAKCACVAGEYYTGTACATCASGYVSYGKTEACVACASGYTSNVDHTACVDQPDPTALPAPAPTALPAPMPTSIPAEGTCYSQSSTVSVMLGKSLGTLAVSEVIPGHRVLAASSKHKWALSKVVAVNKSPATSPYLDIKVNSKNKDNAVLQATEFHTVATCAGDHVPANQLKLGDCLLTVHGHSEIVSITPTPATTKDMTYTLVVEGETDRIFVGGILTHAKPEHAGAHAGDFKHKGKRGVRGSIRGHA